MPDLGRGAGAFKSSPAEPKGRAWSMAAAGTSESSAAPAGSSEASGTNADIRVACLSQRD